MHKASRPLSKNCLEFVRKAFKLGSSQRCKRSVTFSGSARLTSGKGGSASVNDVSTSGNGGYERLKGRLGGSGGGIGTGGWRLGLAGAETERTRPGGEWVDVGRTV